MKALIFRQTGEPKSVLELAEIPTPPLASGEALVRVLLSPINASDLHMVRGRYGYQPELPASPGIERINSQPQGGRLASADGSCIQRREVRASTSAAVPVQDNQRHSAARAGI